MYSLLILLFLSTGDVSTFSETTGYTSREDCKLSGEMKTQRLNRLEDGYVAKYFCVPFARSFVRNEQRE